LSGPSTKSPLCTINGGAAKGLEELDAFLELKYLAPRCRILLDGILDDCCEHGMVTCINLGVIRWLDMVGWELGLRAG